MEEVKPTVQSVKKVTVKTEKNDGLNASMKLEVNEIIETKLAKFISGVQKVIVALGVILGFVGYKSCQEIKNSIKTEAKQEIVNSKLDEELKSDIRKTQLDGILNNISSKIEKENFDDDDIRDNYINLFREFFQTDDVKSLQILKTLNDIPFIEYESYQFQNRPEGKFSLLNLITQMVQKTTNSDLKYEGYKFLVNFADQKSISKLISDFKKDFIINNYETTLSLNGNKLMVQFARNLKYYSEDQEYQQNIFSLKEVMRSVIAKYKADIYTQLYSNLVLLKLSDKKDEIEQYSKSLKDLIGKDMELFSSLITALYEFNLIDDFFDADDTTESFENSTSKLIAGFLFTKIKNIPPASIRLSEYRLPFSRLIKKYSDFSETVFEQMCNMLARDTKEKTNTLLFFQRNSVPRQISTTSSKFFGTMVGSDIEVELIYDSRSRSYYYLDSKNVKQQFDARSFGKITVQFSAEAKVEALG